MHAKREPTAAPGSPRYFAWLYSDAHRRELLLALFEIEAEITASLRPGLEHSIAHLRLAWWREEVERLGRGIPVHPASRRLRELAGDGPPLELRGLVEHATWDLASAPCDTRAELDGLCRTWARAMTVPFAICGPGVEATDLRISEIAGHAGAALRELELLEQLAPDARRGRLRVPVDELDRIGIEPRALATPPWPRELAAHLEERLLHLASVCTQQVAELPVSARAHLAGLAAWCAVAAGAARRAARALPERAPERTLERIADNVRAWRAARGAVRALDSGASR